MVWQRFVSFGIPVFVRDLRLSYPLVSAAEQPLRVMNSQNGANESDYIDYYRQSDLYRVSTQVCCNEPSLD